MSRDLHHLHPDMRRLAEQFLAECKSAGLDILVTCTFRSHAEQQALFEQGRTKPGRIVTNAKPGESAHNVTLGPVPASMALDFVPMAGGKPQWRNEHPAWLQAGEIAERVGLEWAGRWKRFKEFPHVQLPGWRNSKR